jgi:mannose-6-phosphate isomerase-like protein (cupin superfamily)
VIGTASADDDRTSVHEHAWTLNRTPQDADQPRPHRRRPGVLPSPADNPTGGPETMPVINASTLETGALKGSEHGATISLILDHSEPGQGPRLHRHPYDETWVVQEGNLTFQLGDERLQAGPQDIVIAPPGVPHKFTNDGPGRANLVCIYANPTMVTEWLE